jgi:predicted metal-dependent phosphoesterase TrpH
MKHFKADLHVHTCLSPCAELDMSPKAVVEKSLERHLDIIAICDHNSAENVEASIRSAARYDLRVLAGMEINSVEEVHTLAIFESAEKALIMQEMVYNHLKGTNRPELFGDQVVANEWDEVEGFNDRLLIGAVDLELKDIVREVKKLGGLSIASHVDRPSYSILGQLGFVPPDLELDGLEVANPDQWKSMAGTEKYPLVFSSDAHFLSVVGAVATRFLMESPNLDEIRLALAGESGRRVEGWIA